MAIRRAYREGVPLFIFRAYDGYEHRNKYLDILNRWKQDDFKMVDKDHNDMWFIQGTKEGGIATGISTKEQEKDYIFQVFGIPIEKQS